MTTLSAECGVSTMRCMATGGSLCDVAAVTTIYTQRATARAPV
ncbi:MAG TPA: hypothetical protein VFG99_00735 [Chloroflexia bacterium]|nr:hypothetical protein [Chloroflexia bacterium]